MYFQPKIDFFKFNISTHKIISAIPLPRLERGPSGLPFAYSLYGLLFLICSQKATDLLENFYIFSTKNWFFFFFWKEGPLDYHLHIVCMVYYFLYVPKRPLIFYRISNQKIYFQFQLHHIALYGNILLILKRPWNTPSDMIWYSYT